MVRVAALINAVLVLALSIFVVRSTDRNRILAEMYKKGVMPYLRDVYVGLFVVIPVSAVVTWILFRMFRNESRTLSTVTTVFACVFGVLACLYFLWTLRY